VTFLGLGQAEFRVPVRRIVAKPLGNGVVVYFGHRDCDDDDKRAIRRGGTSATLRVDGVTTGVVVAT
jgi:predicted enzyme related to lactoylglutathione lyase